MRYPKRSQYKCAKSPYRVRNWADYEAGLTICMVFHLRRSPGLRERNRNIRSVRRLGRKERFASSGYSRRSLVENAVFRYKAILGHRGRVGSALTPEPCNNAST